MRSARLPVDDSRNLRSWSGTVAGIGEAATSIARQPVRTLLCAVGTIVAVAAFTATNGLAQSARNAVSSSFNELRATTVGFQGGRKLDEDGVSRLAALHGVRSAGLLWGVDELQPLLVQRGASSDTASTSAELPITAATPSALHAIGADLSSGRFWSCPVFDDA